MNSVYCMLPLNNPIGNSFVSEQESTRKKCKCGSISHVQISHRDRPMNKGKTGKWQILCAPYQALGNCYMLYTIEQHTANRFCTCLRYVSVQKSAVTHKIRQRQHT